MVERGEPDEISEQAAKKFAEHVSSAEFGTAQYEAITDYFTLGRLQGELEAEHDAILTSEGDAKRRYLEESNERIIEMRIALHEHKIDQSKFRIQGYSDAYEQIIYLSEELLRAAQQEAELRFPTDKKMHPSYVNARFDDVMETAQNTLLAKLR